MLKLVSRGAVAPPTAVNLDFDLKSRLTLALQPNNPVPHVCYKNITLWAATWDLDWRKVSVWLNKGKQEPYYLMLQDHLGNLFTYGQWGSLKEFMQWMSSPVHIN